MYNTNNEMGSINQNQFFVIEELTRLEISRLKKATSGYGRIRGFSRELGIHENTLRGVILRGSGKPDTIKIIREKLNSLNSNKAA